MRKWRDMERQMAPRSQTFSQGGIRSSDWFSDRLETDMWSHTRTHTHFTRAESSRASVYLFRALHISMVTSTDSAMVIG